MRRRILILAAAVAALVAVQSCKKDDEGGKTPSKPDTELKAVTLKVMSFNIRHTGEASDTGDKAWSARRDPVVKMFQYEIPDIVGFQEATTEQVNYLQEKLPEYAFIAPGNNKCIMYRKDRFTKMKNGQFWLCETPAKQAIGWDAGGYRMTAWVQLKEKDSNQILFFFDTHLDVDGKNARINGAALIVDQMKMICGSSAAQMVVGDMNTSEDACLSKYGEFLVNARTASPDTDDKGTFNGWKTTVSTQSIDYIFARNVTPLKYETLSGTGYGVPVLSDHNPISFTFRIEK